MHHINSFLRLEYGKWSRTCLERIANHFSTANSPRVLSFQTWRYFIHQKIVEHKKMNGNLPFAAHHNTKAMSTPYRIAGAPTQKLYPIGLLFTKATLISSRLLQRSDAAPLRSWKWIVTYRIGFRTTLCHRVNRFRTAAEVKKLRGRIGFHNMAALPLMLTSVISNAVLNLHAVSWI